MMAAPVQRPIQDAGSGVLIYGRTPRSATGAAPAGVMLRCTGTAAVVGWSGGFGAWFGQHSAYLWLREPRTLCPMLQSLKHHRVCVLKNATLEPAVLDSVVIDGIGEKRLSLELLFLLWSIPTGAFLVRLHVKRTHAQLMTVIGGALPL
jgi:hypothetical protein